MTTEHEASRTLVKSPPELWAECSEAASLARHLDQFGEIRITRLEPETAVAWEGEEISGTVRLEPSGWGTRVTMTARHDQPDETLVAEVEPPEPAAAISAAPVIEEPVAEPVAERPEPDPEPLPPAASAPPPRLGLWGRLARVFRAPQPEIELAPPEIELATPVESEPEEPTAPPAELEVRAEPEQPEPPADVETPATELALTAALESLGQAHHRPFSRA
ncbi:MAG TPA: hypothetical protein VGI87_10100 [Solirubrobacteraceae bacterium]|jgi:hypothetical protein